MINIYCYISTNLTHRCFQIRWTSCIFTLLNEEEEKKEWENISNFKPKFYLFCCTHTSQTSVTSQTPSIGRHSVDSGCTTSGGHTSDILSQYSTILQRIIKQKFQSFSIRNVKTTYITQAGWRTTHMIFWFFQVGWTRVAVASTKLRLLSSL